MNKAGHFETYRNPINPRKLWPTVMKEINPPADAKVVHVDLQVTTGPSVRFTVVDPDGKPIAGLKTNGRSGRSSYDRDDMTKPEAEVTNLMPDEERIVLLRHEGRKLGKVVRIKKGDDANGPVVVKLAPLATITGRVADADGNPVSGATIRPDVLPAGDFALQPRSRSRPTRTGDSASSTSRPAATMGSRSNHAHRSREASSRYHRQNSRQARRDDRRRRDQVQEQTERPIRIAKETGSS